VRSGAEGEPLTSREPGRPITILHLSDLRFGWNHPFGRLAPLPMDDSFESMLAHLLADVGSLYDEETKPVEPDLLLITGDLTYTLSSGTSKNVHGCASVKVAVEASR